MLEAGRVLGRYRVENQLGAGGMGEVYRAWDSVLERWVALKVVAGNDSLAQRLLGEARAVAALRHANIVSVHDVGEVDGFAFVSMDLVEGKPLRDWIGDPSVREGDKLAWLLQIASALRAAHKAGFVHRDIKPDNVMITNEGEVRVLDFGLAKSFGIDPTGATAHSDSAGSTFKTQEGRVSGTPAYMAPEQLAGAPPSPSWDQYAWGVLACELLTGKHPRVDGLLSMSGWVSTESFRDVPAGVAQVVARAMAPTPDQRFPSMDAVAAALGAPPSSPSPYAVADPPKAVGADSDAGTNPPAATPVPSATMNVQLGDTLQVPVHPNAPKPQRRPRVILWGAAIAGVIAVSAFAGSRLIGKKPETRTPAIAATTTTSIVAPPAILSAAPVVSTSAAPVVSSAPAVVQVTPPPAPRKLDVRMHANPSLQYDGRTIERVAAGVRPLVKSCIEEHPPQKLPASFALDLELWNMGDELGKVRDVRVSEPPALAKCLREAFMPLSLGAPKDPHMPPSAVFVVVDVR